MNKMSWLLGLMVLFIWTSPVLGQEPTGEVEITQKDGFPSTGADLDKVVRLREVMGDIKKLPRYSRPKKPQGVAIRVEAPAYSDGLTLTVSWDPTDSAKGYALFRKLGGGSFKLIADDIPLDETSFDDLLTTNVRKQTPPDGATYKVAYKDESAIFLQETLAKEMLRLQLAAGEGVKVTPDDRYKNLKEGYEKRLLALSAPEVSGKTEVSWFNFNRLPNFSLIVGLGILILLFTRQARQGKEVYIRRIAGVDAIEEAVGRATEMGRPILYVPGIGEFQEIQTIASLLILGRVAEIVASYDTDMIVPCAYPIVREVADETVKQGYYQAGRPDAFKAENIRFLSSEQFAFTASTNGIILREEPAATIFMGQFFAESLILAETGFQTKSIQIAGTTETAQIPFFVTACDYTLIGEEIYAVSAYLTREPRLTSSLRAADWIRLVLIGALLLGTLLLSLGYPELRDLLANQ